MDPQLPARLPRAQLRGFEHVAVRIGDLINESRYLKHAIQQTVGMLNAAWMYFVTWRLQVVEGHEHLEGLKAPHGIVVVANHRSFFDLYVCTAYLMLRTPHCRRLHFPVRKNYFYDRPLGLLINFALSGCSMWPPIFRDERKRDLNPVAIRQLAAAMREGSLVGIHPEGTRGRGDDPYELLPCRPGLGQILQACHPDTVVLPYFTLGLHNSLPNICRRNFAPATTPVELVRMRFGQPLRAGDVVAGRDPMQITEHLMDRVRELAEQDRKSIHVRVAEPVGAQV